MDEQNNFEFGDLEVFPDEDFWATDEAFGVYDPSPNPAPEIQAADSPDPSTDSSSPIPVSTESDPEAETPRQRTKKGFGPESKTNAPDQYDSYDFQRRSPAYIRLRLLGHESFTLSDVVHLCSSMENMLLAQGRPITERNRAARRRKPNAFHWLDENWSQITPQMYDPTAFAILGNPACRKTRRNGRGK
jgi:hypothetical protein